MTRRIRLAAALCAGALASLGAAAGAEASSIAYVKDGNVWLTSPDGARRYQVTFDGGYASPSQADDGTIVALRGQHIVRMDRSGRLLNAPVAGIGTPPDPTGSQFGPFEPKVSPDGSKVAYWFISYESHYSYGCMCTLFEYLDRTTWTAPDRFTPYADDGYSKGIRQPSWITNDRVLATYPDFSMNVWTWKVRSGAGQDAAQHWFGLAGADGTPYDFEDAELSPDGSKVAATTGGDATSDSQLVLLSTTGPAWAGEPPYDNFDSSRLRPSQPVLSCGGEVGTIVSPTWSPDSRALAYSLSDGVHVDAVPADLGGSGCAGVTGRLAAPGGSEPDWGPAEVNLAQKPAPPAKGGGTGSGPGAGVPSGAPRLSGLALTPSAFRAARAGGGIASAPGTSLAFRSAGPATVTFTVQRLCAKPPKRCAPVRGSLTTAARPGANRLRFRGRIGGRRLAPGRYRLVATPRGLSGRAGAPVSAAFRIVR